MGIRIHKQIGYGLIDLVEDDPRIDWDSPVMQNDLCGKEPFELYIEWLRAKAAEVAETDKFLAMDANIEAKSLESQLEKVKSYDSLNQSLSYANADYGIKGVLCISPASFKDWRRYDNIIDYCENPSGTDSVKVLTSGIWPWAGIYMDRRTGERSPKDLASWLTVWTRVDPEDREKFFDDNWESLNKLASLAGMTHKDAEDYIVPLVPNSIRFFCEYTKVFKDPATILELRPMIYTYWG